MGLKLDISANWKMLRKQKLTLLEIIAKETKEADDLEGILSFIDDIQDQAADIIGDQNVFGTITVAGFFHIKNTNKWQAVVSYDKGGVVIPAIDCIIEEGEVTVKEPKDTKYWDDDIEIAVIEAAEEYWENNK